jgi:hypothetical protein
VDTIREDHQLVHVQQLGALTARNRHLCARASPASLTALDFTARPDGSPIHGTTNSTDQDPDGFPPSLATAAQVPRCYRSYSEPKGKKEQHSRRHDVPIDKSKVLLIGTYALVPLVVVRLPP